MFSCFPINSISSLGIARASMAPLSLTRSLRSSLANNFSGGKGHKKSVTLSRSSGFFILISFYWLF